MTRSSGKRSVPVMLVASSTVTLSLLRFRAMQGSPLKVVVLSGSALKNSAASSALNTFERSQVFRKPNVSPLLDHAFVHGSSFATHTLKSKIVEAFETNKPTFGSFKLFNGSFSRRTSQPGHKLEAHSQGGWQFTRISDPSQYSIFEFRMSCCPQLFSFVTVGRTVECLHDVALILDVHGQGCSLHAIFFHHVVA